MQRRTKYFVIGSFWLSLLLHLLFLLLLSTIILIPKQAKEQQKKSPQHYVPSYLYQGSVNPAAPQPTPSPMQSEAKNNAVQKTEPLNLPKATSGLSLPSAKHIGKSQPLPKEKSERIKVDFRHIMAATQQVLQAQQRQAIQSFRDRSTEPIYLVGEENMVADPLIVLIGKALSANFSYPRMAGEFGVTGRVLVGMTLHPEGYFSDIEIMRSSNSQDLDAAALYAVNNAPNVNGADRFLTAPKHFVIGFIFRLQ